jgi:transposase
VFLLNTSFEKEQEQFAEKFLETPVPHRNAVRRLIEKFHETGPVLDAEQSGRRSKLNNKKLVDISDCAAESIKIIVKLVQKKDTGLSTVCKAF